jgi:hypothetical protein
MFGVLEREVKNISPLYQREDLLNQLAFAVFSASESFILKQNRSSVVLIDRPNLVDKNTKPNSVINRTRETGVLETTSKNDDSNVVQNKTDPIELNLLGLTSINVPLVLLE